MKQSLWIITYHSHIQCVCHHSYSLIHQLGRRTVKVFLWKRVASLVSYSWSKKISNNIIFRCFSAFFVFFSRYFPLFRLYEVATLLTSYVYCQSYSYRNAHYVTSLSFQIVNLIEQQNKYLKKTKFCLLWTMKSDYEIVQQCLKEYIYTVRSKSSRTDFI